MTQNPQKRTPSFGDAFSELEKVTEELENENLDLDKAIEKFERGLALAQQLKTKLRSVEQRVEKIRKKFDTLEVPEDGEGLDAP